MEGVMPKGGRHAKKAVADALKVATRSGFLVQATASGHRWGYVRCPQCTGGDLSVWSTPRVPENMASRILRFVAKHTH
jgi:hypothetical protein